jgi:SAM-dependent methyltransferase
VEAHRRPTKLQAAEAVLGDLSLGERILLRLSKDPQGVEIVSDYETPTSGWTVDNALSNFETAFPGFRDMIRGKRVLDYGCGDGFQSVAMARAGATEVVGADVSTTRIGNARALAEESGLENVVFTEAATGEFDVVTSLNAVEHFVRPEDNLREMLAALAPGGKIYVTFGPLWLSPFGHHMIFFTGAPWINLFFKESTVYRIRSLYRTDGATKYSPDMNRMTVSGFERLLRNCGARNEFVTYRTVKDLPLVGRIPFLREFFVNQVDAVLVPAD